MTNSPYWQSTLSPVHLFRREYESPMVAAFVTENRHIDPVLLAEDLNLFHGIAIHPQAVVAYQRRLGVRKLTGNP